jgi:L,D-transpeptidase YcbB
LARRVRYLPLILLVLSVGAGRGAPANLFFLEPGYATFQELSAEGRAALLRAIDAGRLPDLRCPDFAAYDVSVKNFYQSTGQRLGWFRDSHLTKQARELVALLEQANVKGLNPEDYDGPEWSTRLESLQKKNSESDLIPIDIALTVSAMRYASDVHLGRIDPHQVGLDYDVDAKRINLAEFLKRDVVDAPDVAASFEQLEPQFPDYQRAQKTLQIYEKLAKENGDDSKLSPVKAPLRPGDPYPDIARLTRFLQNIGDLPPDAATSEKNHLYNGAIVVAVKHFQERHGLSPTGRIDLDTFRELNTPLSARLNQLELTLERWRWIPFDSRHALIIVNIPEFELYAFDEEYNPVLTMKVLVGKANKKNDTPLFGGLMRSLVFRPYWNVPPSIERAELLPQIERDGSYITGRGYEIVDSRTRVVSGGDVVSGLRSGRLAIRQRPGENNALGLVKFVFPNEYDIYMHDTPMVKLFSKSRRDLTHGCIRVQNAEELAEWVLRFNPGWGRDKIQAAMKGSRTIPVTLVNSVPVYLVYMTATTQENGEVRFFDDLYGLDAALNQALAERKACSG